MAPFLFLFRFLLVAAWIIYGLASELVLFPFLRRPARLAYVRFWSRVLLFLCGVRVRIRGEPVRQGAVLWVSNHISWVDIFVLNSVRSTVFVAKEDIRRWPIIGLLVERAGTMFIDRGHRHAVRNASQQIQSCFVREELVGLFPEGTTTDGSDVRGFHAGLFDAPIQAEVPVQPVALRFLLRGQRALHLAFVGEQTLVANLWYLLGSYGVVVECEFLPPITVSSSMSRSALARQSQAAIRQRVHFSGNPNNPAE